MFALLPQFMCLVLKVKKFEFGGPVCGGEPPLWHPQFLLGLVYLKYLSTPNLIHLTLTV